MMSVTLINLPDLLVSALKLLSASFIVFEVVIAVSVSKRDWQSRYVWVLTGLSLVTLVWLLNSALTINTEAIAFLYPHFFGLLFLLGPAVYFGFTDKKVQNISYLLLHISAAAFISIGRWSVSSGDPLTLEFIQNIVHLKEPLSSVFPNTYIGNDLILYVLLPVHFFLYGLFTLFQTKKIAHAISLALILSIIGLFVYVYAMPGGTVSVSFNALVVLVEVALIFFILRYLIVGKTMKALAKEKPLRRLEVRANDEIIDYLSDFERCQRDFSSSDFSVDTLTIKSNIDLNTWRNHLEDEGISFTTLKKRIRINYAQRLLANGFLDQYTVEYLTATIGYQSRTSFYTAFKEVTGKSFAERDNAS